jgi:hypothetical protein
MSVRNLACIGFFIVVAVFVAYGILYFKPSNAEMGEKALTVLPTPIVLRVDKASISERKVTPIRISAVSDRGKNDEKLELRSDDLGIDLKTTLKELRAGLICEAQPQKTGIFELVATQGGVQRGSVSIASHQVSTLAPTDIRFELFSTDAIRTTESGILIVELFVAAVSKGKLVTTDENLKVRIFDRAKDKRSIDETVYFQGARSRTIAVPLDQGTDASFQAQLLQGKSITDLNTLQISWAKDGPKLRIKTQAIRPRAYATAKTPCKVAIQLEYNGVRVIPRKFDITPELPEFVSFQPAPPITINTEGFIVCDVASSRGGGATIKFTGPSAGSAEVALEFKSVLWFHIIVIIAGLLVGIFFLLYGWRKEVDFLQFVKANKRQIVWHGLMSAFGAAFLSFCVTLGLSEIVGLSEPLLTGTGALILGTIGGLIGEGIVHLIFPYVPAPNPGN